MNNVTKNSATTDSYLEYNPNKPSKLENTILKFTAGDSAAKSKPDMKKLENSSVLDKVKSFLPDFKISTLELEKKVSEVGNEEIDIENVTNCDQVIQFDLSLIPNMEDGIPDVLHDILNNQAESDDSSEESSGESEPESDGNRQKLIEEM